jgi:hypothetical protein
LLSFSNVNHCISAFSSSGIVPDLNVLTAIVSTT